MQPKISIVMPVYNVELYIEECLNSLLNQTLQEFEIICVDDGSTDGTLKILDEFQKKDARIKIIHQQNQFAGVARNNGLQHATGEYVIFLDSDDFFEPEMLEKTYEKAIDKEADVVLFGVQIYDDVTGEIKPMPWAFRKNLLPKDKNPFNRMDMGGRLLEMVHSAPWNKLYKREFVVSLNLQFQALQNSNDVFFTYVACGLADNISYVDEALLNYRRNIKTSLQSTRSKAPYCFFEAYYETYRVLEERGIFDDLRPGFNAAVIDGILYNFEAHKEEKVKNHIIELLNSERGKEMNLLFLEEDQKPTDKYCKFKGLIEGYAWKSELDRMKAQKDAEIVVKSSITDKPKVSVVIPCYNVEKYVAACLDSIANQTLKEIEIICVNDGSSDNTLQVLVDIAKKDQRISVLTQVNAKQAVARNRGAEVAQGEYLYFMDSDDLLELTALETLYEKANTDELDLVCFDGESFFESEELQMEKDNYDGYYIRQADYSNVDNGIELMCQMRANKEYRQQPCLLFMNRKFFVENELWFYPGIYHEDNPFVFKVMLMADKVAHIKETFFKRRVREGSVMTQEKSFDHAYGYFASYFYMLDMLKQRIITEDQKEYIGELLISVMNNARKTYRTLPVDERYKWQSLDGVESKMFFWFVTSSKYDVDAIRKELKELETSNKKLKKRIKNQKKQISEANAEIERLQNELERVKRSATFNLKQIIKKIVKWLGFKSF